MAIVRGRPSGCGKVRPMGKLLMALGALLLVWVVPIELWTAVLGIVLMAIGFLLWKFG